MQSVTDRIVRQLHSRMKETFGDAGQGEILDHLAWEVGSAASELVNPTVWVRRALVAAGACATPSEAQARIARIVSINTATLELPVGIEDVRSASSGFVPDDGDIFVETRRCDAVVRMEEQLPAMALILHARLESCPQDEIDQAASTMIALACEHGDPDVLEDVVVSLLIFSHDWRTGSRPGSGPGLGRSALAFG